MPSRVIRGEINSSVSLNRVSIGAELTFDRLITAVDDFGRFDARREMLKAALFPVRADAPPELVMEWIRELTNEGCVQLYEVDGRPYLVMCAWEKHFSKQRRAKKSRYPDPPVGDETPGNTIPGKTGKSPEIPGGVGVGVGDECSVEGVTPAASPPAPGPIWGDSFDRAPGDSSGKVEESEPDPSTKVAQKEGGFSSTSPGKVPNTAPQSSQSQPESQPNPTPKPKRKIRCPEELTPDQWVQVRVWRDKKYPGRSNAELEKGWDRHANYFRHKGTHGFDWVRSLYNWLTKDFDSPATASTSTARADVAEYKPRDGPRFDDDPEEIERAVAEAREQRRKPARHAKAPAAVPPRGVDDAGG